MEASRLGNLILGLIFCVESDVEIENTEILNLDFESQEKRPYVFLSVSLIFLITVEHLPFSYYFTAVLML